ncbi:hypothetical protein PP502_gp55 [Gordonia phage Beenie]|uniref:Uncharacterized protein n=1 Tax=Gordonia phage Beenie TaxID=2079397 RepID=A0A2K9VH46_9CAUD|nr:hypothetical protein PP502_gp55 [Gordonia phage Beenie]AUV61620.1 hypothetical protein PBI_BEENIE_55 [Gordonia phage Beenie]
MTTPNLEQIIAAALRDLPSPIATEPFEPGWWRSCVTWEEIVEKAAPAVAAAIRDSGLTVIALPEPSEYTPSGQPSWSRAISVIVGRLNEIVVGHTWWISRHEAADLGAALLAAAQVAERNNP